MSSRRGMRRPPLPRAIRSGEPGEEPVRVVRPGPGLGVVLHAEEAAAPVLQPLASCRRRG